VQKKIISQLQEFGRTKRGWLGVQITPVTSDIAESLGLPNEMGAFVSNINPDGPSKKAGIQEGDVILKFNNNEIIKMTDLPRVVAESDVGSIAIVELWRKNEIINIEIKLGELPEETYVTRDIKKEIVDEIFIKSLDLSIKNTTDNSGVIVTKVNINSNLKEGDIIIEVNREIVSEKLSFRDLVSSIEKTGRNSLLLKILRDGKSLWITIQFLK
jgi:serine protease Do